MDPAGLASLLAPPPEDAPGDLVGIARPVNLDEDAPVAIDLDEGGRMLGVQLCATTEDVLRVVGADLELCALERPPDDLVLVDCQGDRCIRRWPVKAVIPSSSSTWASVRG